MDDYKTGIERLRMRIYDENHNVIEDCDESNGWFEDGAEQNEFGEWIMTRVYHPYTAAQLAEIELQRSAEALAESRRDLTPDEVINIVVRAMVNSVDIPDKTSLRMMGYYPEFSDCIGQTVSAGFKFVYDKKLYKVIQPSLTITETYPPGTGTESLYTVIDVEHTGDKSDPIPYSGNMELFNGKYYSQDGVVYLCNRDTGTPVYHPLSALVGLYVKVAD